MKKMYFLGAIAAIALCSCQQTTAPVAAVADDEALLKVVEDIPTAQAFLSDPVPEADIQRIINAGVNTPSAMNKQPWHFSVVSDAALIAQFAEDQKSGMKFPPMGANGDRPAPPAGMTPPEGMAPPTGAGDRPMPPTGRGPKSGLGDSPVVIFISCPKGGEFDAGLACEGMNVMANVLGYGTKIASSVVMLFNGDKKAEYYQKLQIPEGQEIVTAILLGKLNAEAYDAVSSATPRNPQDQVVTFVK